MMKAAITVLAGAVPVAAAWAGPPSTNVGGSARHGPDTVLRLARSGDGYHFEDLGQTLATRAAAPDLTRLPDGSWLVLLDRWIEHKGQSRVVLAASRSKDGGASWSPLKPVRIRDLEGRSVPGRHADLVDLGSGRYRLYFASDPLAAVARDRQSNNAKTVIRSAAAAKGLDFRVEDMDAIALSAPSDLHPTAIRVDDRVHLYATALAGDDADPDGVRPLWYALSDDGRRFEEQAASEREGVTFVGSIVPTGDGLRAYVTSDEGIGVMTSPDGHDWTPRPGVVLPGGFDPAVAQLDDGSYLMVYCVPAGGTAAAATPSSPGRVAAAPDTPADVLIADAEFDSFVSDQFAPEQPGEWAGADALTDNVVDTNGFNQPADESVIPPDTDQLAESSLEGGMEEIDPLLPETADDLAERMADDWFGDAGLAGDLSFAPDPDFNNPIDYFEWFQQNLIEQVADNAADAYERLMPDSLSSVEPEVEWPELINMFSDPAYDGPPAPWDPLDHPDWEASHLAAGDVLNRFREAGMMSGYALRPKFSNNPEFQTPDGQPLLLELLLPSLGPHRALAKATLADAWRTEDGVVAPQRMLEAMETTLRNANHVGSGTTLIESLVGTAERALVQENARWALRHGVFDEQGLEEALDLLMAYDVDNTDPIKWTRGEHAMAMQTVQFMFDAAYDQQHRERVARTLLSMMDSAMSHQETIDAISELDRLDAREAVDGFNQYYRRITEQMRTDYAAVRAADIEASAEQHLHTNALTELLLPSLSRVHLLRTRSEASRRATQLAYAAHLFEARNGRWPSSLDELSAEYGQRMRTDPFSGSDFGYRVTADGPTIYSASENGLDDGGIHSPRWNDEITNEAGSDDYVFWPPQEQPR